MKKFLVLMLMFGLFAIACNEDNLEEIDTEGMPTLSMTLNATAFLPGDIITATITDISEDDVVRGDLTLYFSLIDLSVNAYDNSMLVGFPETAFLSAAANEVSVDFTVSSDIEDVYSLRLVVAAEGTAIDGANQDFTIGNAYLVNLAVTDSEDGRVKEGSTFTLQAVTNPAPAEDLTITFSFEDGTEGYFSADTTTIVIPAGETQGVSGDISVINDSGEYQNEISVNIYGTTSNNCYEVGTLSVIRVDKDTTNGEHLDDEHWVYVDPDASFYSQDLVDNGYFELPSYKPNDVLMRKYNFSTGENGSSHPNETLAEEGWTLLNACEFHAKDGWSFSRTAINSWGVHPVDVQNGWGAQNTEGVEKSMFVQNNKYTDVTDKGYLRMWACPEEGETQGLEEVYVSGSACYANKVNASKAIPQNTPIGEGTRIEIRARLCGDREGFLFALWLQGNATTLTWPEYGEIDILENHVNNGDSADARNYAEQTLHWGTASGDTHANPTVKSTLADITEWNIYWVEIVDDTTVKFGVNGQTTATFTNDDNTTSNAYTWPFCNSFNPSGFHILLTMYPGWNFPDRSKPGDWGTAAFQNLEYEDSITSDVAPRMEIDWIRYWKNDNYDYNAMDFPLDGNNVSARMF